MSKVCPKSIKAMSFLDGYLTKKEQFDYSAHIRECELCNRTVEHLSEDLKFVEYKVPWVDVDENMLEDFSSELAPAVNQLYKRYEDDIKEFNRTLWWKKVHSFINRFSTKVTNL